MSKDKAKTPSKSGWPPNPIVKAKNGQFTLLLAKDRETYRFPDGNDLNEVVRILPCLVRDGIDLRFWFL